MTSGNNRRRSTNNVVVPPSTVGGGPSGGGGGGRKSWGGPSHRSSNHHLNSSYMNNSGDDHNHLNDSNDQLANQKNQWNAERDIPSGTVRNNPFVPKRPEKSYQPQLAQQKKQWDRSDLPKGNVMQKAMSVLSQGMENDSLGEMPAYVVSSPRKTPKHSSSPRGVGSGQESPPYSKSSPNTRGAFPMTHPSSNRNIGGYSFRTNNNTSPSSLNVQTPSDEAPEDEAAEHPPVTTPTTSDRYQPQPPALTSSNLRGRLIENPFLQQEAAQQQQQRAAAAAVPVVAGSGNNKWAPNKEIPRGSVKDRAKLFGSSSKNVYHPAQQGAGGPSTEQAQQGNDRHELPQHYDAPPHTSSPRHYPSSHKPAINVKSSKPVVLPSTIPTTKPALQPIKSDDSEDPWIISPQKKKGTAISGAGHRNTSSSNKAAFTDAWGQTVAKSTSEDWDDAANSTDWIHDDTDPFHHEEKKSPEPSSSRKPSHLAVDPFMIPDRDPFQTVHDRDNDVLQAAKYKAAATSVGGVNSNNRQAAPPKNMIVKSPKDTASILNSNQHKSSRGGGGGSGGGQRKSYGGGGTKKQQSHRNSLDFLHEGDGDSEANAFDATGFFDDSGAVVVDPFAGGKGRQGFGDDGFGHHHDNDPFDTSIPNKFGDGFGGNNPSSKVVAHFSNQKNDLKMAMMKRRQQLDDAESAQKWKDDREEEEHLKEELRRVAKFEEERRKKAVEAKMLEEQQHLRRDDEEKRLRIIREEERLHEELRRKEADEKEEERLRTDQGQDAEADRLAADQESQYLQDAAGSYEDRDGEFYDASATEYSGPPNSGFYSPSSYNSRDNKDQQYDEDDPALQNPPSIQSSGSYYDANPADTPDDTSVENVETTGRELVVADEEPKKKKKGGFFKFFARGKDKDSKEKDSKAKKGRKSLTGFGSSRKSGGGKSSTPTNSALKESSRVSNSNPVSSPRNKQDKKQKSFSKRKQNNEEPSENRPEGTSKANYDHEQLYEGRSADDTTISDMTLPTVFKDGHHKREHVGIPPQLSTIESRETATPTSQLVEDETLQKLDPLLGSMDADDAAAAANAELSLKRTRATSTPPVDYDEKLEKYLESQNRAIPDSRAETPKIGRQQTPGAAALQHQYLNAPPPPPPPGPPPIREEIMAEAAAAQALYSDPDLDHINVDDPAQDDIDSAVDEADPDLDHLNMDDTDSDDSEPGNHARHTKTESKPKPSQAPRPLSEVRRQKVALMQRNKRAARDANKNGNEESKRSAANQEPNEHRPHHTATPVVPGRKFNPRYRSTKEAEPSTPPRISRVTQKKDHSPSAEKTRRDVTPPRNTMLSQKYSLSPGAEKTRPDMTPPHIPRMAHKKSPGAERTKPDITPPPTRLAQKKLSSPAREKTNSIAVNRTEITPRRRVPSIYSTDKGSKLAALEKKLSADGKPMVSKTSAVAASPKVNKYDLSSYKGRDGKVPVPPNPARAMENRYSLSKTSKATMATKPPIEQKVENGKGNEQKFAKANRAYQSYGKSISYGKLRVSRSIEAKFSEETHQTINSLATSSDDSEGIRKMTAYERVLQNSMHSARTTDNSIYGSARSLRTGDDSINSTRSTDSNSVTSDIRVLRSILRRPRRSEDNAPVTRGPQPVFPSYDENNINDPMQRAGLRLLSAAIIPIQTEVRRFLAMRRALTRMWALIVIQTYTRRWIARKQYLTDLNSIVTVQSVARKRSVQNDLIYQHICAIEIQRFMRGYLATMQVYEDIYKVTMIQSYVRMRLARDEATYRMALVIQAQALARGFLVRRRNAQREASATSIQAHWRCFYSRLTYQFDLLDIVIVQSVWRKRMSERQVEILRQARYARCATVIQTQWRSYDCTMNYLHYLADVLISQSAVRRFLAQRRVDRLKYYNAVTIQTFVRKVQCMKALESFYAARKIQSAWRGYICYVDLQQFYAARKIQSAWRGYAYSIDLVQYYAARKIQAQWRGFVCHVDLQQYYAAQAIQRVWRGLVCYTDYQEFLAARTIQSAWRRKSASIAMHHHRAARTIQRVWRGLVCFIDYQEYLAARDIQKAWRCYFFHRKYQENMAARDIQKAWRCHVLAEKYKKHLAARNIQRIWRGHVASEDFILQVSALRIQTAWRGRLCKQGMKEYYAARTIQRVWRGHVIQDDFKEYVSALRIQTVWRRHAAYKVYKKYRSAVVIQKIWRGFVCYADYMFSIADIVVAQRMARGWIARRRAHRLRNISESEANASLVLQCAWKKYRRNSSAIKIQKTWRRFVDETEYVVMKYEYYAARTIQSYWRRFWCFSNFIIALDCSIQIQAVFRGYKARKELELQHLAAVWIQSGCRQHLAKKAASSRSMIHALESASIVRSGEAVNASTTIQKIVRGHQLRTAVSLYSSATRIQALWRGYVHRTSFKVYISAVKIQAAWRGFVHRSSYEAYVSAVKIQAAWRGYVPRVSYKTYVAARRIQTLWRCKNLYKAYRFYKSALEIQRIYRGVRARQNVLVLRGEVLAATLIQSAWRGFVCYTDYVFSISDIIACQKVARGFIVRKLYRDVILDRTRAKREQDEASTKIASVSRGFMARQRYWYTLGCTMQLQSWIRGRLVVMSMRREKTATLRLQCFARRYLARQQYLQRKFIFNLIKTAEQERVQKLESVRIQAMQEAQVEGMRREKAARVIQRFFLMVKREVDRMVRDKRRRHKNRKKSMQRGERIDEDMLEDAWSCALSNCENEPGPYHQVSNLSMSKEWGPAQDCWAMEESSHTYHSSDPMSNNSQRKQGSRRKSSDHGYHQQHQPVKNRHRLPPGYSDKPSTIVRLTHMEDDVSEFSGFTSSTAQYVSRPPPSRIRLSSREMEDDMELEEAFIDAEIYSARERRMADSHIRKTSSSRQHHPQYSTSGRMSPAPIRMSASGSGRMSPAPIRMSASGSGRMSPAPIRMSASAPNHASPARGRPSPIRGGQSPMRAAGGESPMRGGQSPARGSASPMRRDQSPMARGASPMRGSPSPSRLRGNGPPRPAATKKHQQQNPHGPQSYYYQQQTPQYHHRRNNSAPSLEPPPPMPVSSVPSLQHYPSQQHSGHRRINSSVSADQRRTPAPSQQQQHPHASPRPRVKAVSNTGRN